MADVPNRYRGKFSLQFVHPLLVRCAIDYAPFHGPGPSFRQDFLITPDGILVTTHSIGATDFGVTWPLLENDGASLHTKVAHQLATTCYGDGQDEQCFLSATPGDLVADAEGHLQSTYGWLLPVRAPAIDGVNQTFVYPRNATDPSAEDIREHLRITPDGFESPLGSVHGTLYVGRTSAGGEGASIDCDGDGQPDAIFDPPCGFILQLDHGKITAVEADRETSARVGGKEIRLKAFTPVSLKQ
jgi:hypothetical protein